MALTTSYLISIKNTKIFLDSLIEAKAPSAFTQKFIEGLGFKSTNDRLYISVLKGLGFIDQSAVPQERYFRFLDRSESKRVMAEAVEDAYGDLFALNKKAYELPVSEVKNKLRTLTQGKYSENVIGLMSTTFKALADYSEWTSRNPKPSQEPTILNQSGQILDAQQGVSREEASDFVESIVAKPEQKKHEFHYNIQVHLPESRDEAVYDAIFKSIRRHLL